MEAYRVQYELRGDDSGRSERLRCELKQAPVQVEWRVLFGDFSRSEVSRNRWDTSEGFGCDAVVGGNVPGRSRRQMIASSEGDLLHCSDR